MYHKSQAVRPAGKRLRESDSAEGFVGVCQWVTGGLALGMGAEMDGSLQVFTPPWSLKGGIIQVLWPVLPDIAADSPTARRRSGT